jgi:hypothetical protein
MTRLRDKIHHGTASDVVLAFPNLSERYLSAADWISKRVPRTDESVTLINLLNACESYLRIAASNVETHISATALAARSLYELNLQVRAILRSQGEFSRWLSEAVTDKVQILEGILELGQNSDQTADVGGATDEVWFA